MRDVAGPVTSEVVRQRLSELFAQLQGAPPTGTEASVDRPVETLASASTSSMSLVDARVHEDDEEWLSALRTTKAAVEAPPRMPTVASTPVRELAGRVRAFTVEHLATVVVVLLVGVGWTAYSLMQVRATPVADAAPRVEATPSAPASVAATAAAKQLVIHVIGAVVKPGVVHLPDGSRVADAIAAAGGLSATAGLGELNLAQPLVDGTQLKIGTRKHPGGWMRDGSGSAASGSSGSSGGGSTSAGGQSTKVSLNSATIEQLDTLPGIGPVTAQKIIDWRKAHGTFTAITELQEVDGIGPKTYADLADRVRL
jgi:competence protein ComEA